MMEQKIQLLSFPPSQRNKNNNDNAEPNFINFDPTFKPKLELELDAAELKNLSRFKRDDSSCDHAANKYLCLPLTYSKFELPHTDSVNVVEIGIDISDVLRINDKVRKSTFLSYFGGDSGQNQWKMCNMLKFEKS